MSVEIMSVCSLSVVSCSLFVCQNVELLLKTYLFWTTLYHQQLTTDNEQLSAERLYTTVEH